MFREGCTHMCVSLSGLGVERGNWEYLGIDRIGSLTTRADTEEHIRVQQYNGSTIAVGQRWS